MQISDSMPRWTWLSPLAAIALAGLVAIGGGLAIADSLGAQIIIAVIFGPILIAAVFAAVYHAEFLAHWTGEPYGTLILTAAVTLIELALIVSVMLSGKGSPELARDTVYAAVMIVCNGIVGLCILAGGLKYREQSFEVTGANIYLAVLIVLAALTLVLPNYTTNPGPAYTKSQLAFEAFAALALYLVFLYTQTVRHTDYFVQSGYMHEGSATKPAPRHELILSLALLLISIVAVVLLAKQFASAADSYLAGMGLPRAVTGVLIAILILLPEGTAAYRAAARNDLQTSLNLALGASIATIGLTIPCVAAVVLALEGELVLGLPPKETVLLVITFAASMMTLGTGRTNILFGFLHLVIFGTFLFLTIVP